MVDANGQTQRNLAIGLPPAAAQHEKRGGHLKPPTDGDQLDRRQDQGAGCHDHGGQCKARKAAHHPAMKANQTEQCKVIRRQGQGCEAACITGASRWQSAPRLLQFSEREASYRPSDNNSLAHLAG